MFPGFFAYPNHESQRLTIAILLALAAHGLLIFGLQFDWRLTEFPDEPRLDLAIAIFEPAEDRGASGAAPDSDVAEQPLSPSAEQQTGGPTAEPLEVALPPMEPPAPAAASEPATPATPATLAPEPETPAPSLPVPAKPSEPVLTAPRPRATAMAQRLPAEPAVRPAPAPKSAPAPAEKPAPKIAPSPTPANPTSRQTQREEKTSALKTPPAPPTRSSPPRQEITEPGAGKAAPAQAGAAEAVAKPNRSARRLNSQDLLERGLEMARRDAAAELPERAAGEQQQKDAAIMTLQRFYEENWARQVERSGVIPAEAVRLQLTSGPTLAVVVRANGSVQSITVLRSSGHAAVDQAARAMVYQAAPYAPFPPELRRYAPTLRIVRQWTFKQGRLVSQ